MVENTCRDMVLYRPIYGPGEDWDLPELIPLADWDKHVAHKISILAYDPSLPYVPYVACDSSLIKKAHGYGEADAAGSASTNDLLKGEAYVDIDYLLVRALAATNEVKFTYDISCQFVCPCRCLHQVPLRAKL